jgi:RecB family exonuclease
VIHSKSVLEPGASDVLEEELQRFDSIPIVNSEFESKEGARPKKREKAEKVETEATRSDTELLEAELSGFIDRIETKKEKVAASESSTSTKSQTEEGKRRQRHK